METVKKRVLITGATSGIGGKIALHFAENGWDIFGHTTSLGLNSERLSSQLRDLGCNIVFLEADFRRPDDVERLVHNAMEIELHSLVNNAGTYISSKDFTMLELSDLTDVFMVNAFTPILLTSRLFSGMKERGFGRIVNISSIAAKYGGSAVSMHYGCSKRALEGLTKTVAANGAQFNVLANTIRPGVIDTDFHKRFPKDMKRRVEMIPLKKMGDPGDIAEMAYYLGSDKNNFITNEIITVSGGE